MDDMIVFGTGSGSIMRISSNGGNPETIVTGENNQTILCPQILPDGKSVLFAAETGGECQVAVQSLESGERKELFPGGPAKYVSTGHIVYALGNSLYAVPFDPDTLKVTGGQVPLVEGVLRTFPSTPTQSAISESGTLVYLPGTTTYGSTAAVSNLVWVDRQGREEPLSADPKIFQGPRISPDGTKIAVAIFNGNKSDIYTWDQAYENMTRLTFNENSEVPLWTLDGKRIVFVSGNEDEGAVYWRAADGTGNDELLGSAPDQVSLPMAWSADGKTLVTMDIGGGRNIGIGSLSIEDDHTHKTLMQEVYVVAQPEISSDGQWMAYSSTESGDLDIFVRPFPDANKGKWQVSTEGGDSPLWSPNGKELFYRKDDGIIAVSIETEPTFKVGKREILFHGNYVPLLFTDRHPWDISPDGRRFLMMKPVEGSVDESATGNIRKINIVLNWFEELKDRVPVD